LLTEIDGNDRNARIYYFCFFIFRFLALLLAETGSGIDAILWAIIYGKIFIFSIMEPKLTKFLKIISKNRALRWNNFLTLTFFHTKILLYILYYILFYILPKISFLPKKMQVQMRLENIFSRHIGKISISHTNKKIYFRIFVEHPKIKFH